MQYVLIDVKQPHHRQEKKLPSWQLPRIKIAYRIS
jgi:hypothetical protein